MNTSTTYPIEAFDTLTLIDVSISMINPDYQPTRREAAIQALLSFLNTTHTNHPHDRVGIVQFSKEAHTASKLVPITNHCSRLKKIVKQTILRDSTNITAGLRRAEQVLNPTFDLKKSVNTLSRLLFPENETHPYEEQTPSIVRKQRVILLSDGDHNQGAPYPEDLAQTIKQKGITIEVIGIGDRSSKDFNEERLKKIASPGKYSFIGDPKELTTKFKSMALRVME